MVTGTQGRTGKAKKRHGKNRHSKERKDTEIPTAGVGKEAIRARNHRFLSLPTHQPLQLLTAELAQKDISPGHSQVFQPAGNWTHPTDQKGAVGLGVTGKVHNEKYKDGQMKEKPIPLHLPFPLLPSHTKSPIPDSLPPFFIYHLCYPFSISLVLFSQSPTTHHQYALMKAYLGWP